MTAFDGGFLCVVMVLGGCMEVGHRLHVVWGGWTERVLLCLGF